MKKLTLVETSLVAGGGCSGSENFAIRKGSSPYLSLPLRQGNYLVANVTMVGKPPLLVVTCGDESRCSIGPGKSNECPCEASNNNILLWYSAGADRAHFSCEGTYWFGCI